MANQAKKPATAQVATANAYQAEVARLVALGIPADVAANVAAQKLAELPAAPVLTSPLLTTAKQPAAAKVAAGPSDGIATALDVLRNAGFTVDIKATKNPAYLNAYVFHAAGLRGSLLFKA